MESTPLISLNDAATRYKNGAVIGPVSLTISKGDFIGIVGPNGSGKTTLLRLIAGLLQPCRDRTLDRTGALRDASKTLRSTTLSRRDIALLLQHHTFTPTLPFTVEDIAYFGCTGRRGPGRRYTPADHEAVERALVSLGIEHLRSRLYRELSGGEKQKTQFARLLAQRAELLLLDEPAAGLDLEWRERLTELTGSLHRDHGRTIVMVTHEVDRLPACCNRTVLIHDGKILAQGSPDQCLTPEILQQMYGCRVEVTMKDGRRHVFGRGVK